MCSAGRSQQKKDHVVENWLGEIWLGAKVGTYSRKISPLHPKVVRGWIHCRLLHSKLPPWFTWLRSELLLRWWEELIHSLGHGQDIISSIMNSISCWGTKINGCWCCLCPFYVLPSGSSLVTCGTENCRIFDLVYFVVVFYVPKVTIHETIKIFCIWFKIHEVFVFFKSWNVYPMSTILADSRLKEENLLFPLRLIICWTFIDEHPNITKWFTSLFFFTIDCLNDEKNDKWA